MENKSEREGVQACYLLIVFPLYVLKIFLFLASPVPDVISLKLFIMPI